MLSWTIVIIIISEIFLLTENKTQEIISAAYYKTKDINQADTCLYH